jgi:hypothetical protein
MQNSYIQQIEKDARKAVFKQQVSNMLKYLGIEETDAVREFIDATINEVCCILPHSDEATKTLQVQLQQSNNQLQNKLNNVQQVVQA